jgi:hypothetical protein
MRSLIGLIGACMVGCATATLIWDIRTGLCIAVGVAGCGLFADAVRK